MRSDDGNDVVVEESEREWSKQLGATSTVRIYITTPASVITVFNMKWISIKFWQF